MRLVHLSYCIAIYKKSVANIRINLLKPTGYVMHQRV